MYGFWGFFKVRDDSSMVSRVKQGIWKGFRSMKLDLESFLLWLENWIWKVKKRR